MFLIGPPVLKLTRPLEILTQLSQDACSEQTSSSLLQLQPDLQRGDVAEVLELGEGGDGAAVGGADPLQPPALLKRAPHHGPEWLPGG